MQSALGSATTIASITKANPGVVSCVAHGYSNGDILFLQIQGMYQLHERAVRVANKTNDTYELEGINTTNFETFSSGTAEKVTMGTSISSATSISASGGDFDFIDTTTIHQNFRTQIPGLPAAISFSMDHIWDSSDAGQAAMKAASDIQAQRVFKFQFGSGGKVLYFAGYVGFAGLPGGSAQNLVTTQAVITMNGLPTYYAS
jgi:hypothetical protein